MQSDVYALGAMLYQMVVGDLRRPLAPGWEREIDDALLREDIAAASDVDPAKRLADAGELARRLRSLEARHADVAAARVAASESERLQVALVRAQRRRRWAIAVAVVAGIGIAVTGSLLLQVQLARQRPTDRPQRRRPSTRSWSVTCSRPPTRTRTLARSGSGTCWPRLQRRRRPASRRSRRWRRRCAAASARPT